MQKAELSESHRAGQLCPQPPCWTHHLQSSSKNQLVQLVGGSKAVFVLSGKRGSGMGLGGRDYTWGEGLCGWMIE